MFHVRPTGDLGKCTAASGKCPFRNEGAQHFSTFKDAAAHAEKIFADEAGGVFSKGISSQEWRAQAERAVQAREDARRMREGRPASFTAAIGAVYP